MNLLIWPSTIFSRISSGLLAFFSSFWAAARRISFSLATISGSSLSRERHCGTEKTMCMPRSFPRVPTASSAALPPARPTMPAFRLSKWTYWTTASASMREKPPIEMFSRSRLINSVTPSLTLPPPDMGVSRRAPRSAGLAAPITATRSWTNFWKSSLLATGSVSQQTLTRAPSLPSSDT